MDGKVVATVLIVGGFSAWGTWYLARAYSMWSRLCGERIVTCPETGLPAAVHVDLAMALTSDAGSGPAPLDACSCWKDRGACDMACAQKAQLPTSSAAAMVGAWAKGRICVSCGGDLTEKRFTSHHMALFEPGGISREWVDIGADRLPLALATSLPLCWNCHMTASFRRLHAELESKREFRS